MNVPFVNLGLQYQNLREEILNTFDYLSSRGEFILGEELEKFEKEFAKFCNTKYSLGLGNGSDGLSFSLKYYGIGQGDEVILPANTFVASAWSIANIGAIPVFVDVKNDYNIDPEKIKNAISSRTKAIMPVHLTGKIAEMFEILKIAKSKNLIVIEDSAQAIGASYKGKNAGSFGNTASFSLHPLKNLHVHGDGGVLTTNNYKIYKFVKKIRNHGLKNRDELEFWGYNSRLDNINAAIARIKLKHVNKWNIRFRKIAKYYTDQLKDYIVVPKYSNVNKSVYHRYIIQSNKRNELKNYLLNYKIHTAINYPIPLHLQKASKYLGYKKGDLPIVEKQSKKILSLPIYNELSDYQVEFVVSKIKNFIKLKL